ncbi:hypothetical protein ANANG_G00234260 [Anguilla anguilla]|uniref:Uncharacterized protein n=1 Tax=Anguilla anguilla TaxID=7936 RepID=A0A9D3RNS5_ANGAN|nr:hypothetical protein ANANG_G00234260 [Anguilla anguilla]
MASPSRSAPSEGPSASAVPLFTATRPPRRLVFVCASASVPVRECLRYLSSFLLLSLKTSGPGAGQILSCPPCAPCPVPEPLAKPPREGAALHGGLKIAGFCFRAGWVTGAVCSQAGRGNFIQHGCAQTECRAASLHRSGVAQRLGLREPGCTSSLSRATAHRGDTKTQR